MAGVVQKILIFTASVLTLHATTTGVAATTEFSVDPPDCIATGRYPAPACYQYYDCVYVMWWWEAQLITCPDNQNFDINLKACALASLVDCQFRTPLPGVNTTTSTTTSTTTVAPPTLLPGPPTCTGPGKHPAPSCYNYYECVQDVSVWRPVLATCVVGYAFDVFIIACVPVAQCDCQNRLTTTRSPSTSTTSVAPPTLLPGPPTCTGPGKHPAPSCYNYYECIQDVSVWRPVLATCVVGYAFDVFIIACVPVAQCDCQNRLTTTRSPTTSTTPVAPPTLLPGPPTCTGPGKHPAPSCYNYYECIQDVSVWRPVLSSCVVGYAFDVFIIACVPVGQCDCQNRLTTTTSSTTSTTSVAPPIIIGPPTCTGPGRYPATSCYDYYECIQDVSVWKPVLATCVVGYAFDIVIIACVPVKQCDCQNRLTTTSSTTSTTVVPPVVVPPSCSGPGKHPASSCYDYYECVQEVWWWKPVLKNCVVGYAFDIFIVACVPVGQCDCQNRVTTTRSPTTSTTAIAPPIINPPSCSGPGKYPATSCYDYYECERDLWWWKPVLKTCVVGYAFDVFYITCVPVKQCDCQNRVTTTVPTSTLTLAPPLVIPPSCTGPGKHPALSCYDYYECVQDAWWWKPVLKTCVVGYAFDVFVIACVPVKKCDCQNRVTTTVSTTTRTTSIAPPIINPPSCSGPGKHPAQSCSDYYECEQELWWWKPVLKNCVVGYAFDVFYIACVPVKQCDCQNRVTTTVSTTTSTTSIAPPVINPPSCSGPGKHPAPSCYDYYECEQELWWWKPVLKNCVVGYAFDIFFIACVPVKQCDCQNRVTTTVSTTTSTTRTTPAPPVISVPSCPGPGKHPAPNCYQYYDCQQKLWWWEPILETCNIGYAFDIFIIACVPVGSVACQDRITTTVAPVKPKPTRPPRPPPPIIEPSCSGPGKHPASSCYEYYECVPVWWWWEPKLLSCKKGYAFDVAYTECRLLRYVDCHHRRTTTIRPPTTAVTPAPPKPPPIVVPACNGPSKHPAPICYQYYECVQVGWWWAAELKTCTGGESFDIVLGVCYPSHVVDCQHRSTTTRAPTPTTAITTPRPRPPPPVPRCRGYSKHPAPLCYQYYECVQNWWWWEPKLKTCPEGEGFDRRKGRCFCAAAIGCKLPITVPKCSEPGKYPAHKCNQYYECVPYFWWWQPELKNCPKGKGFATSVMRCVDKGYDCTLENDSSKENSSEENSSKENSSKENSSEENSSKENNSKENSSKENGSKEVV